MVKNREFNFKKIYCQESVNKNEFNQNRHKIFKIFQCSLIGLPISSSFFQPFAHSSNQMVQCGGFDGEIHFNFNRAIGTKETLIRVQQILNEFLI
jgi:hypothetical protein